MSEDVWNYLKSIDTPICLYGTGNGADKIIAVLESKEIKISGIFASDGFVRNRTFHGFKVKSYAELKKEYPDMTVLLCFGSSRPEVIENVKKISAERELLAPDVPVYGNTLFDTEFYEKNKSRFFGIREKLADGLSKRVFDGIINYKLSGDIKYLTETETETDKTYSLLSLGQNETYLDLGAYNGDTVAEFISKAGSYSSVTAVEPDSKSFAKLLKNTENLKNVTCINACIHSFDGETVFDMKSGRNSNLSGETGKTVKSVTVDEICKNVPVSFIKFDIEGNEDNALCGAAKTLSEKRPKLRIAAYHRSEDLFAIPERVLSFNPDYKVYLRHNPSLLSWDTDFIFI